MNRKKPDSETPDTYRTLIKAAVVTMLVLLATASVKSYRDLAMTRTHEAELERQVESTREEIQVLQDRIRRIREDPGTLEQLAREELGWVREGDVVIVLPEETDSESADPEAAEPTTF